MVPWLCSFLHGQKMSERFFFAGCPSHQWWRGRNGKCCFIGWMLCFSSGKDHLQVVKGKVFNIYIYICFSYVIFVHIHLNINYMVYISYKHFFYQCKYFIYGWYTEHDFISDQWVKYYDDQRLQYCLWNLCKCVYEWDFSELYFQPCITDWLSIYLGVPNRWHIKNVSVSLYLRKTSPIFWYVSRFF